MVRKIITKESTSKNQRSINEYTRLRPLYEEYVNKLKILFEDILRSKNIRYQTIEARAKTIDSFSNKLSLSGNIFNNPIKEITDLAGVRIILFYQEDVDKVCSILKSEFKVDPGLSLDKRTELAFDQFGYISVHLIIHLSTARTKLPEWNAFKNMVAEVQVRTVLQHAWASISHLLQYKRENDIPLIYRRKLVRLSGLLELADEEFSELNQQQQELKTSLDKQISESILDTISIDSLSITRYLMTSSSAREISKEVYSHTKFRKTTDKEEANQLPIICRILEISTIAELDNKLLEARKHAQQFFTSFTASFTDVKQRDVYGDTDHWCSMLLVATHTKAFTKEKLNSFGITWGDEYINALFKASRTL